MYGIKIIVLFCFFVEYSSAEDNYVCIENYVRPNLGDEVILNDKYEKAVHCFKPNCNVKGKKRSVIIDRNNICAVFSDGSQEVFSRIEDINDYVCYKRIQKPEIKAVRLFYCNKDPTV